MTELPVERCLEDLEQRVAPAVEEALFREWEDFTFDRFRGDIFSPRRPGPNPPRTEWPAVTVNAALDDFDAMLLQQVRLCSDALDAGNGGLLCVRSNYGTGILPTLFGARLFRMDECTNTLPTATPLEGGLDAMRRLLDQPPPDPRAGLGTRTLEMGQRFTETLRRYPRLGRYVHVYHPDLQGPIDVCEVLWGSSLFLDVWDHPALVHAALDRITETYARFLAAWAEGVPFRGETAVHWSFLHRGRIMLRDDSAMNFSPAMYEEFIRPHDQRLLRACGGGAMHFCGRGDHYIARAAAMEGLHAVNLSQPECNDMETIFRHTVDRGLRLLGLARPAAEAALARGRPLHGRVHCA